LLLLPLLPNLIEVAQQLMDKLRRQVIAMLSSEGVSQVERFLGDPLLGPFAFKVVHHLLG